MSHFVFLYGDFKTSDKEEAIWPKETAQHSVEQRLAHLQEQIQEVRAERETLHSSKSWKASSVVEISQVLLLAQLS